MSGANPSIEMLREKEKKVIEMDVLKQKVTLGYGKYKLFIGQDQWAWGVVNDRGLTKGRQRDMLASFKSQGIQQIRSDTTIAVGMRKSWIEGNLGETVVGKNVESLVELKLSDEGKMAVKEGKVQPLEGLGRRGGVELYRAELNKEIGQLKGQLEKMQGKKGEIDHETIGKLKGLIKTKEGEFERSNWWAFRVLDLGE